MFAELYFSPYYNPVILFKQHVCFTSWCFVQIYFLNIGSFPSYRRCEETQGLRIPDRIFLVPGKYCCLPVPVTSPLPSGRDTARICPSVQTIIAFLVL